MLLVKRVPSPHRLLLGHKGNGMGPLSSNDHFRPEASAVPGNLLEMQILQPHVRPTESESLGWDPAGCGSTRPPGDVTRTKFARLCAKIS